MFNFTVIVVHTGAGINDSTLRLVDIRYREASTDSDYHHFFFDQSLSRGEDPRQWHGILSNIQFNMFRNLLEFGVAVRNNFEHESFTTVTSEYGNVWIVSVRSCSIRDVVEDLNLGSITF